MVVKRSEGGLEPWVGAAIFYRVVRDVSEKMMFDTGAET